jgi:hypothetical protein
MVARISLVLMWITVALNIYAMVLQLRMRKRYERQLEALKKYIDQHKKENGNETDAH